MKGEDEALGATTDATKAEHREAAPPTTTDAAPAPPPLQKVASATPGLPTLPELDAIATPGLQPGPVALPQPPATEAGALSWAHHLLGRRSHHLNHKQIFCLLDIAGLIIAMFSTTGDLMQWAHSDLPGTETQTSTPPGFGYWYQVWLFSIICDGFGLAWLAVLSYFEGFTRRHYSEWPEFYAMVFIWISGICELYASVMYEPLPPAFAHIWPWLLFTSVRHSWTLASLGNFIAITLLMISYMPYASARRTLGWDFWGLLGIAVASTLQLNVVNPHRHGTPTLALFVGGGVMRKGGLGATRNTHRVYTVGWTVSGLTEAVGMTVLIVAEVYDHMYVKGNDAWNTFLTIALMPPPDTSTENVEESDTESEEDFTEHPGRNCSTVSDAGPPIVIVTPKRDAATEMTTASVQRRSSDLEAPLRPDDQSDEMAGQA